MMDKKYDGIDLSDISNKMRKPLERRHFDYLRHEFAKHDVAKVYIRLLERVPEMPSDVILNFNIVVRDLLIRKLTGEEFIVAVEELYQRCFILKRMSHSERLTIYEFDRTTRKLKDRLVVKGATRHTIREGYISFIKREHILSEDIINYFIKKSGNYLIGFDESFGVNNTIFFYLLNGLYKECIELSKKSLVERQKVYDEYDKKTILSATLSNKRR